MQFVKFQVHIFSCHISLFQVPHRLLFISLFSLPWKSSCTVGHMSISFFPKAQKMPHSLPNLCLSSDSHAVQRCQIQTCGLVSLFNKGNLKLCKSCIKLTSAFIQLKIICTRLAPSWCKQGQLLWSCWGLHPLTQSKHMVYIHQFTSLTQSWPDCQWGIHSWSTHTYSCAVNTSPQF